MANRGLMQSWRDPTLFGRQMRWFALKFMVFPIAWPFVYFDGVLPLRVRLVVVLAVSIWFAIALLRLVLFHRRITRQATKLDLRMCQYCGYDLREVEEPGPCPECGRKFEVADLRDYWERKFEGRS
jgi:hypothetical protein